MNNTKEKFREKQSLEEWDEKVNNLIFLLRQKPSSMTNLEFLEETLENGDYESQKSLNGRSYSLIKITLDC